MNNSDYKIRTMTCQDLNIALKWAAKEGWNPGLYDANCFYATDSKGYFIGCLGEKPISCISAVSYDKDFGFLGLYIVKPEYRNKGYGIQIWNKALKYLNTQNIGLDGVIQEQDNYKKSGFKLAYRNIRYEGAATGKKTHYSEIVKLSEIPFAKLTSYDHELFPARRNEFLKCWIKQPESLAIGSLDKKNNLTGYGVVRKCQNGYKIGPLFADDKIIAEKLFLTLIGFIKKDELYYLDCPEINLAAVNLAKKYNMKYVFETARMYTKEFPKLPLHKIFGVTTFELG